MPVLGWFAAIVLCISMSVCHAKRCGRSWQQPAQRHRAAAAAAGTSGGTKCTPQSISVRLRQINWHDACVRRRPAAHSDTEKNSTIAQQLSPTMCSCCERRQQAGVTAGHTPQLCRALPNGMMCQPHASFKLASWLVHQQQSTSTQLGHAVTNEASTCL